MKRLTTLAVLAVSVLAVALPANAAAWKAPTVTRMQLAVEVTGIHVVDWHYQDAGFPDPERTWVSGNGTQTLGFSAAKPTRYTGIAISGSTPDGAALQPLALTKLECKPLKGSLRRKASWRHNDGNPCDTEGHCDPSAVVGPTHQKPSCPAKRRDVPVTLEVTNPGAADKVAKTLTVGFGTVDLSHPWPNCPPDIDGISRPLTLAQPRAVLIPGGVDRIARLRRGQSVTLKGSAEIGAAADGAGSKSCPPLSGVGLQQCAVTDVTVEVKRLR